MVVCIIWFILNLVAFLGYSVFSALCDAPSCLNDPDVPGCASDPTCCLANPDGTQATFADVSARVSETGICSDATQCNAAGTCTDGSDCQTFDICAAMSVMQILTILICVLMVSSFIAIGFQLQHHLSAPAARRLHHGLLRDLLQEGPRRRKEGQRQWLRGRLPRADRIKSSSADPMFVLSL